jgi:hypothetical protein
MALLIHASVPPLPAPVPRLCCPAGSRSDSSPPLSACILPGVVAANDCIISFGNHVGVYGTPLLAVYGLRVTAIDVPQRCDARLWDPRRVTSSV